MTPRTQAVIRKHNSPLVWIVLLLAGLLVIPPALFKLTLMNVHTITVHDAVEGSIPVVDVDRAILNSFYGRYSVVIREKGTQRFICEGEPNSSFVYQAQERKKIYVNLAWWLGGDDIYEDCVSDGLAAGTYYSHTCHYALGPYGLELARRCVRSNEFTIYRSYEELISHGR